MTKILIVEDDTDINNLTAVYLRRKGLEVEQAFSGTEGKRLFLTEKFDLAILDLMLPGMTGEELTAFIRKTSRLPIIVLTAKGRLEDKVELLGGGADDYLTKPFELEELWMRIQVQLRHAGAGIQEESRTFRDWELDLAARCLLAEGKRIELTAHEFGILELLTRRPNKVFTKQEIYEAVWEQDYAIEDKTINVHISNIRSKLKTAGAGDYIQTVWGIGFKMISQS